MNFKVVITLPFKKDSKKLIKKYSSLKDVLAQFIEQLEKDPFEGTAIGRDCYKVRLPSNPKAKANLVVPGLLPASK